MDVSLHPQYSINSWIYISYLNLEGLAMASRLKIQDNKATQFEILFKARNQDYTGNGMRIVWEDDAHFFLNIGNSNWSTYENPVMHAQDFNHDAGKIHRLMEDGSIPDDNPIFEGLESPTTIWSFGLPAYTEIIVLALDSRKSKGWFVKGIKKRLEKEPYVNYKERITLLDLSNDLDESNYYILDDHMNDSGHQIVTDKIEVVLRNHKTQ